VDLRHRLQGEDIVGHGPIVFARSARARQPHFTRGWNADRGAPRSAGATQPALAQSPCYLPASALDSDRVRM
jgi:hypothetical protein